MTQTDTASSQSKLKARLFRLAVIIVNLAALVGQSLWMHGQLIGVGRPLQHHHKFALAAAILFAVALESIGTYLALQAHAARIAEQAAGGLQFAAYAVGVAIAAMNYTHFKESAAELGMVLAAFSLANPWLWSIESRASSRALLAARGDVDPRGVKLSTDRKIWHPIKSLKVKRHASWSGERNPQRAVEAWEADRSPTPVSATVTIDSPLEPVTDPGLVAALDAADRPAIEAPPVTAPRVQSVTPEAVRSADLEESVTETVTETVTRTRTQTRTSRFDAMVATVTDRVNAVKAARPDWEAAGLDYTTIGGIIQRSGRDTIKPVYAVLYKGVTVEEAVTEVLAKNG